MPTYDYRCGACSTTHEIFHSMTQKPRRTCPSCGKNALERQLGTGGAIIFKGSGFYQTDYRSESYRKAAQADAPAATPAAESAPNPAGAAASTPKDTPAAPREKADQAPAAKSSSTPAPSPPSPPSRPARRASGRAARTPR